MKRSIIITLLLAAMVSAQTVSSLPLRTVSSFTDKSLVSVPISDANQTGSAKNARFVLSDLLGSSANLTLSNVSDAAAARTSLGLGAADSPTFGAKIDFSASSVASPVQGVGRWSSNTLVCGNSGAAGLFGGTKWLVGNTNAIGFNSASHNIGAMNMADAPDVLLYRDAAGTLAQRNSTNAQTFRVYGTESSSLANYVRGSLSSSSTAVTLAAESAGTGAADLSINVTPKNGGGIFASGQSLTGSQATSLLDLATTWNTTGTPTALKLNVTNTASNAASLLMDLQADGTSRLSFAASTSTLKILDSVWWEVHVVPDATGDVIRITPVGGSVRFAAGANWIKQHATAYHGWSSSASAITTIDTKLYRDAAATLALRNGTNAQTFRVYGTESSSLANYVRGSLSSSTTAVTLAAQVGGTHASDNVDIVLTPVGTGKVKLGANLMSVGASDDALLGRVGTGALGAYQADGTTISTLCALKFRSEAGSYGFIPNDSGTFVDFKTSTKFRDIDNASNVVATIDANGVNTTGKVTCGASTTTIASLSIPSGTAPTSPVNGDIWSDGSDLITRLGGVTHTLDKVPDDGYTQIVVGTNNATTDNANFDAAVAAIAATASKTGTVLIKGTCKLTGVHAMATDGFGGSKVSVKGISPEESHLDLSDGSLSWVAFTGGWSAIAVTVDGRSKITQTSGGPDYAVGDYCVMQSDTTIPSWFTADATATEPVKELFRISQDNINEIEGTMVTDHPTNALMYVNAWRTGIRVENLKITSTITASNGNNLIFYGLIKPVVTNCDFQLGVRESHSGVVFDACFDATFTNNKFRMVDSSHVGTENFYYYGVRVNNCQSPLITDNTMVGFWQLIDLGGSTANAIVSDNHFYGVRDLAGNDTAAVSGHPNHWNTQITNNTFNRCTLGVSGYRCVARGNTIDGVHPTANGSGSESGILIAGFDGTVENNTIHNRRRGIVQGIGSNTLIQNNRIFNCPTVGILIWTDAAGRTPSVNPRILHNTIQTSGQSGSESAAIHIDDTVGAIVRGNQIPKGTNTVSVYQETGAATVLIQHNYCDGYGSANNGIDSDDTHSTNYTDP